MKDRTILVSAFVACSIHALILFSNFGPTPPVAASADSSINVALVAPPAIPASAPARAPGPEKVETPEPVEEVEPIPIPEPETIAEPVPEPPAESIIEPIPEPEPIETPEPAPVLEPEPAPEQEAIADAGTSRTGDPTGPEEVPPVTVTEERPVSAEISEGDAAGQPSADLAGDARLPGGSIDSIAADFDRPPAYMRNPKPRYPRAARRRGEEGKVLLLVEVLADGRVGEISVESSSGYELLDTAAVKAVRKWRFVPARKENRAVRAQVKIPVEFSLKDRR